MYSRLNENSDNQIQYAEDMMNTCMGTIHDMLMQPMKDKLTPEEDGVLALVGLTLKIIAEKATAYEKAEQLGNLPYNSQN